MSQLVALYEKDPVQVKGDVEILQTPRSAISDVRSVEGFLRTSLVYVRVPGVSGALLVPFGQYDDWSLRDRYNEAIRIMNSLGAATITCETYGEVSARRGLRVILPGRRGELTQTRIKNSGFDFRHTGAGSTPRDPRPLSWPDEPGFAAAVASVMENGATEVVINIRSTRTHAVDGSLGVQLKGLGFELGGTAQRSAITTLHISASFPQPRRRRW